jgi:hypothetical protein
VSVAISDAPASDLNSVTKLYKYDRNRWVELESYSSENMVVKRAALIGAIYGGMLCIAMTGCSGDRATAPYRPPPAERVIRLVSLQTYDGSGEAVHPDAVTTPVGWGDGQAHLVVTPYPGGMWTVNSGSLGCFGQSTTVELRRSTDGVTWSGPETVQLGDNTQLPWHIDVTWIAELREFWTVFNVKTSGSCTTQTLRFATSPVNSIHRS